MSGQLTYPIDPAVGFAGMLAQQTNVKQADSKLADGVVRPGFAVKASSTLGSSLEIAAASDVVQGIAIYSDNLEQTSAGVVQFADTAQFSLLHKGRIFVTAGEAVAVDAPVFAGVSDGKFYNDNGGASQIGVYTMSGDFVTSNSITIQIDGVDIAGSPVVFDNDNTDTIALVAAALLADSRVLTAVVGSNIITVTSAQPGESLEVTSVVTLGAGQITVSFPITTAAGAATRATVPGGVFRTAASTDGDLVTIELW